MKLIKHAALAATALAVLPAWAVNKCTGPDGAVVFQDSPCGMSAKKAEPVKIWDSKLTDGGGKVRIGMTEEEVLRAWGKPDAINSTVTAMGVSKQLVYGQGLRRQQYLYIENGVLRTIQSPE